DISDDIDQYHKTAGAAESAYLQAGAHYTTLLAQLKAAVTRIKSSVANCKQKTAPPHGSRHPQRRRRRVRPQAARRHGGRQRDAYGKHRRESPAEGETGVFAYLID